MIPTFDPAGTFVSLDYFLSQLALAVQEAKDYSDSLSQAGFSEPLVRATVLTGLSTQLTGMVTESDSILSAIGKLENRIAANENNGIYWGTHDDPNGNVTATGPAFYYKTDGSSVWLKTGLGTNNTGWIPQLGGPATG